MKDYYKILNTPFSATSNEIKKAYRKLAFQYHPDRNNAPDAVGKFIDITEAHEVLCDEAKRTNYDYLHKRYFRNDDSTVIIDESIYQQKQEEWTNNGKRKAQEYSSMRHEDFTKKLFEEVKIGIHYIPNLIFIFFCVIGMLVFIVLLFEISSDAAAPSGMGIVAFLFIVGLSILCYSLFKRMQKDYREERKRRFKK